MIELIDLPLPINNILHFQENTTCYIDEHSVGNGKLFLTGSCISWLNSENKGLTIGYCSISISAISRDLNSFPHPCVYLMVNSISCRYEKEVAAENSDDENIGNDDDDDSRIIEVRFVPNDIHALSPIYEAICKGNELNPSPDDDANSEDDGYCPEDILETGQGDGEHVYEGNEQEQFEEDQFENADDVNADNVTDINQDDGSSNIQNGGLDDHHMAE